MILVVGGTGLVGSKVVDLLLAQQQQVRVLAGGLSDWRNNSMPHFRKMGVDVVTGDIRDQRAIAKAVSGCTGIIHTAGIMYPTLDCSLESVNHQSVASLLPIAQNAGVQRLVFVSCLGATRFSHSEYLRSKWEAETLVRDSELLWTIFRPSLIFGDGSFLMRSLEFWTSRFPFILVIGGGLNEIQPVSADDVAACIVQALYNRETVGQTYDLAGPERISLTDLMQIVSQEYSGRVKPVVKLPAKLALAVADMLVRLNPSSPVSSDVLQLLSSDNTADLALMRRAFQVPMLPFESQYRRLTTSR